MTPKRYDYNLAVIGAGSGGLVAALIAATLKARVALIEKNKMGGDCLNTGCVPSKTLIKSAKIIFDARRAQDFGLRSAEIPFDFLEVMNHVQKTITKIEPHDSVKRYQEIGVDCIAGEARLISEHTIAVAQQIISARNIVIATGASPLIPPIPGLEQVRVLTSDSVWNLKALPKKLLILGGGPVGCELAQCLGRLGSRVTLVEMMPQLLNREDPDVSSLIARQFQSEGIRVLTGHKALRVASENGNRTLICESEEKSVPVEFDEILVALGRKPRVTGFGLEELGIILAPDGTINHDEFMATNCPHISVCGDVAGPYQFTHTASHQAWYATVNSLFSPLKKFRTDDRVIPSATFTDPEVARVGLNETEATQRGILFEVTQYQIDDLDRAITDGENRGFVKVLTVPGKDRILGVTVVGHHGSDTIAEYVLAMKHGLGLNKILNTIHIYPTLSEANRYAAGVWKRAHAPRRLLNLLEKFHRWRRG